MSATAEKPAVAVSELGRRFGRHWAVAHVDLRVEPGETVLLGGPNGSGKTTLLRLICGLYRATRGRVEIFGHDPRRERLRVRRSLSLVSHDNYLYPPLTALEMVRTWARLLGLGYEDARLLELLEEVGLERRRHHRVGGFSAGMRKRMTLVRTRLENPQLILLDEPLSTLDAEGRRMVERWIAEHRRQGRAVVVASHAIDRLCPLADRGVLMRAGQIVWTGPAGELPARVESG